MNFSQKQPQSTTCKVCETTSMNGKLRLIKLVQTEMTSITIGDKDIMIPKPKTDQIHPQTSQN